MPPVITNERDAVVWALVNGKTALEAARTAGVSVQYVKQLASLAGIRAPREPKRRRIRHGMPEGPRSGP